MDNATPVFNPQGMTSRTKSALAAALGLLAVVALSFAVARSTARVEVARSVVRAEVARVTRMADVPQPALGVSAPLAPRTMIERAYTKCDDCGDCFNYRTKGQCEACKGCMAYCNYDLASRCQRIYFTTCR